MAEDSEKRFQSVMDKLFHGARSVPKASSSSSGFQLSPSSDMQLFRGQKRPNPTSALALADPKMRVDNAGEVQASAGMSQAPLCRPWDRGDLMRRLSTFKSMTWFAKPKAVSAVNCARRGWVNVDIDTIACEACGARLLFSTSSSWSREQVEKAALVFSLKLDSGHKLLCPWTDNTCDETLAQFPPTTPQVLADQFRERSSSLAQLLALPVISSSAIEFMRSPQLDQFLQQSSLLEYGDASAEIPSMEYHENGSHTHTADLYYQALKVITLCGWEPRVMPYVVDCKMELSNQSAEETNDSNSSKALHEREKSIICIPAADLSPTMEANRNFRSLTESVADPQSVVLDCKLCGASVGLWAFSTVPRPMEAFRLVGFTGINNKENGSRQDRVGGNYKDQISAFEPSAPPSNLNLTIAGGPPPTQQNFKATVSFPVVGRSIRARFSSDPHLRNYLLIRQENSQSELISIPVSLGGEGNKADEDTSGSQPPSSGDSHGEKDENFMPMGGHLGDSNGKNSSLVVASDQADKENTSEVAVGCSQDLSSEKNASEESPVLHAKHTRMGAADKGMGFDPIRQHRHFCPWIASTGGLVPGWQQVLSALQRQKEGTRLSPMSSPSASLIKVDDPITSVRRLFMSKRMKTSSQEPS